MGNHALPMSHRSWLVSLWRPIHIYLPLKSHQEIGSFPPPPYIVHRSWLVSHGCSIHIYLHLVLHTLASSLWLFVSHKLSLRVKWLILSKHSYNPYIMPSRCFIVLRTHFWTCAMKQIYKSSFAFILFSLGWLSIEDLLHFISFFPSK